MPACRYRLQNGAVGSFIDRSALHSRFHTTPLACRTLSSAPVPARDNPQTSCRGWSLPVRLRCTRKTGRAQQQNTNAATGSSAFSSRIHPEPNRRSAFSRRLSQVAVKCVSRIVSVCRRPIAGEVTQVNKRPLPARNQTPRWVPTLATEDTKRCQWTLSREARCGHAPTSSRDALRSAELRKSKRWDSDRERVRRSRWYKVCF